MANFGEFLRERLAAIILVAILSLLVGGLVVGLLYEAGLWGRPVAPSPAPSTLPPALGEAGSKAAHEIGEGLAGGAAKAAKQDLHRVLGGDPEKKLQELDKEIQRLEAEGQRR